MATTFSQNLLLIEPAVADPTTSSAWGGLLNTDMVLIDSAMAGSLSLSVAGNSNVILTSVQGQPDQARNYSFVFTGLLTGNIVVLWPQGLSRNMRVTNSTTGNFTLSCGCNNGSGLPAGATYTVPQGSTSLLASDGTNVTASFNDGFLPLAGGTLKGATSTTLALNVAAVNNRSLVYQTAGLNRWNVLTNNTAEAGANAGSNLFIQAYNDAGSLLFNAVGIVRATGVVTLSAIPVFPTATAASSNAQGANTQYVDTAILTYAAFATATYFPIGGGTITGNVTVGNGGTATTLQINGIGGSARNLQFATSGSLRWQAVANAAAESGANAGSNWFLESFDDSGVLLQNVLSFSRATGIGTFSQSPIGPTPASTDNTTKLSTTAFVRYSRSYGGASSSGQVGSGSFALVATTGSFSVPASTQYFLTGSSTQTFAGAGIWGLQFLIDGVTTVNGILAAIQQTTGTITAVVTLAAGSHNVQLQWLGGNSNVTMAWANIIATPIN